METSNYTIWVQISLLAAQVVVVVLFGLIAYFKIYRHRIIYGIKRYSFHPPTFEPRYPESETEKQLGEINKELVSGKYTILQMVARTEYDIEVYLGQVKK